jgi:hypothetical protein
LNGTRRWKMEPLVRIWRDPANSWSHRYEVANGNRYYSIQNDRDNTEFELCREFTLSDAVRVCACIDGPITDSGRRPVKSSRPGRICTDPLTLRHEPCACGPCIFLRRSVTSSATSP